MCRHTTGVWSSFLVTQFFSDSFMGNAAWGQEKDRMGNKKLIYVYLLFLMLLLDLYRDSEKQVLAENGSSMLFMVPIYASESVSTISTCSYVPFWGGEMLLVSYEHVWIWSQAFTFHTQKLLHVLILSAASSSTLRSILGEIKLQSSND